MDLKLSSNERIAVHWMLMMLPIVVTLAAALLLAIVVQPFFFILAMFFLAWLLAFLLDPIVSWIVRRLPRLPRGLTAALVFVALTLLILVGLVAIASSVLSSMTSIVGDTKSIPEAVDRLIGPLQKQLDANGISINLTDAVTQALGQLQQSGADLLQQVLSGGVILFTQGTAIIFIAIVMVANKGRFLRFGQRLMPAGQETLLDELTVATTQSFGGFIRGQFGLAGLYGVVLGVIAFLFGVPFVALIAVLTAALQSIPYFGQLVSWLPLFATTLVFAPTSIVPVTITLVIGLLIIQNIISPRVLGSAVGMNPILVLAAVFIGAQLAGALGAVFGVPVAAVGATLFNAWLDQIRPPALSHEEIQAGADHPPAVAEEHPELAPLADPAASATDILAAARAEIEVAQDTTETTQEQPAD